MEPRAVELRDFEVLSFDCYGTLIDWEAGIAAVLRSWADRHGLDRTDEQLLTAYSTHEAQAAIARVRRAHAYIRGTACDGRSYRADDPDLLTWVHTAEVSCFLAGYQAFSGSPLTSQECDRYFAEVAVLAERLGARDVPRSVADAASYFARMRPELAATPAALEAVGFLRGFGRDALERLVTKVLMNGGITLLPSWARAQLGIRRPGAVRILLDRPAARLLGDFMIWACGPSEFVVESRARIERAQPSPAAVHDQPAF